MLLLNSLYTFVYSENERIAWHYILKGEAGSGECAPYACTILSVVVRIMLDGLHCQYSC